MFLSISRPVSSSHIASGDIVSACVTSLARCEAAAVAVACAVGSRISHLGTGRAALTSVPSERACDWRKGGSHVRGSMRWHRLQPADGMAADYTDDRRTRVYQALLGALSP